MRLPDYFDLGGQKLAGSWRLVIGHQESALEDKSCSIPGAETLASWPMLNCLRQARRCSPKGGSRRSSSADKTAVHVGAVLLKNK